MSELKRLIPARGGRSGREDALEGQGAAGREGTADRDSDGAAGGERAEELTGADLSSLSDYEVVEAIAAQTERINAAESVRLRLIKELHSRPCMSPQRPDGAYPNWRGSREVSVLDRDDLTQAELSARLPIAGGELSRLIASAVMLTDHLPATFAALSEGRLDLRRAQQIQAQASDLFDDRYRQARAEGKSPAQARRAAQELIRELEERVLKRAPTQTPDKLGRSLTRAVNALDPDYAERRRRAAVETRFVTHRPNRGDSTGDIYARLGAADALGVFSVIDTYARLAKSHGDERTLANLRADTLVHLILHRTLPDGTTPEGPTPEGPTPEGPTPEGTTSAGTTSDGSSPNGGTAPDKETAVPDCAPRTDDFPADAEITDAGSTDATSTDRISTGGAVPDCGPPEATGPTATSAPACSSTDSETTAQSQSQLHADADTESETAAESETQGGADIGGCTGSSRRRAGNSSATAGLRAHVNVTVGLETLLGLNEDTADLAGHGPITAPLARALAFAEGSTWRRLITDPVHGYLLDYGRTTYRPPAALADHVRARDVTCRMPNCDQPATACDLDHLIAYPTGTTCEDNLCAACRRDHRLKHEGRWQHQLSHDPAHPPGTTVIISPTGHTYLSHPYSYTTPDDHAVPNPLADASPTDVNSRLDMFGRTKTAPGQCFSRGNSVGGQRNAGENDDPGPPPF
jgi:uncharacterized protein DUF222